MLNGVILKYKKGKSSSGFINSMDVYVFSRLQIFYHELVFQVDSLVSLHTVMQVNYYKMGFKSVYQSLQLVFPEV